MPMEITYTGGKSFKAITRGLELISDQPGDAGGANLGFTPPELLIASLGTCIGVYIEDFAKRHNLDITGMKISLNWKKAADPVRLGEITCLVYIPQPLNPQLKTALQKVAEHCLIHNTLTNKPIINIAVEAKNDK